MEISFSAARTHIFAFNHSTTMTSEEFLRLTDEQIERLPEGTFVHGNVSLINRQIRKLPENLIVEGWLEIVNCPYLKKYKRIYLLLSI